MSSVSTLPAPTESEAAQPVVVGSGERTWSAGTLTYTRRGLIALFAVLLIGDFVWYMRERSTYKMVMWYVTNLEIPNFWYGVIITALPNLIQLFLSPIISVMSDRHRGPRGRRIPYLMVITPFVVLGMAGMAVSPHISQWLQGAGVVSDPKTAAIIWFTLFWVCFDIAAVASGVVFFGLINDTVPRTMIGTFYGFFRAISLVDGMIFSRHLQPHVPDYYTWMMIGIGVAYGVGFFLVCRLAKEGTYPSPPAQKDDVVWRASPAKSRFGAPDMKTYCRECFSRKYYISVFVLMMLAAASIVPINTFANPYAKSLGIDMQGLGECEHTAYFISLCLCFFIGWVADKVHPLRLAIGTLACYAAVTVWGAIYGGSAEGFPTAYILHIVLGGCYITGTMSLGPRLFPKDKFAQFYSAALVLVSVATILVSPLVGALIDASATSAGPEALTVTKDYRLAFVVACCLSVCALIAGIVVYIQFQKLGGVKHYRAPGETETAS